MGPCIALLSRSSKPCSDELLEGKNERTRERPKGKLTAGPKIERGREPHFEIETFPRRLESCRSISNMTLPTEAGYVVKRV